MNRTTTALLVVAALYWLPEHIAHALSISPAAVGYVASGIEAGMLWCGAMLLTWGRPESVVFAWAANEAAMRPICRLGLPMDRAPDLPANVSMCHAAYGPGFEIVSYGLVAAVLIYVAATGARTRMAWLTH